MPVFDFDNDWRDIRFRESDAGPDSPSQDRKAEGGGNNKPVLSFYFWIYLIVSFSLTAITVFGWWRYTRTSDPRKHRPNKRRIPLTKGSQTVVEDVTLFSPEYGGGKGAV